jgi:hypothetical protein
MLHLPFMHPANFKNAWYFEENYIQGLEIEKVMPGSMSRHVVVGSSSGVWKSPPVCKPNVQLLWSHLPDKAMTLCSL